jgi:hypothetical protein
VIWQIQHHFPTIEVLQKRPAGRKNVVLGPLAFTIQQIVVTHPILFPLWLIGRIALLPWHSSES